MKEFFNKKVIHLLSCVRLECYNQDNLELYYKDGAMIQEMV